MTTDEALFSEFARILSFPHYFGRNWDAFEESLTAPEDWEKDSHERKSLRVDNAECILLSSSRMNTFVEILLNAQDRLRFTDAQGAFEFNFAFSTTAVAEASGLWTSVARQGGLLVRREPL